MAFIIDGFDPATGATGKTHDGACNRVIQPTTYLSEAMSMTKRYFTSLLSRRSYASLIC
jgi:hypothetical protein